MDRSEIADRIHGFLEEQFPNEGVELTVDTVLLDEWFIDSLGITETVIFLESSFEIDVSRADINGSNFRNIASLSEFVARRLSE